MMETEFNTMDHSPQYNKVGNLLTGGVYKVDGKDEFYIYNPPDETAMNAYTNWLKDVEIVEINKIRKQKSLQYNMKIIPLQRLAYLGDGQYAAVNSMNEKRDIEKSVFGKSEVKFDDRIFDNVLVKVK